MQEKRASGISKELVFRLFKVNVFFGFLCIDRIQIMVTELVMVTVRIFLPSSHF